MSRKVAIVTDSTAYIPQEFIDQFQISVAPQVLIWGEETFEDGVDIQPTDFYYRLEKATTMPSTSQVTPANMEKIFVELTERGFDILAVLISEKLSGTIPSAIQAKELVPNAILKLSTQTPHQWH